MAFVVQEGIFNIKKALNKALTLLCLLFFTCVLCSCSSTDKELIEKVDSKIKDPVTFKIEGIDGDLSANVQAYLTSMPIISFKKIRFYTREIKENTKLALHAYGYYKPSVELIIPSKNKDLNIKTQDSLSSKSNLHKNLDNKGQNKDQKTNNIKKKEYEVIVKVNKGKALFIRSFDVQIIGQGAMYKTFRRSVLESNLKSYGILNHGAYDNLKDKLHNDAISLGFFDAKIVSSRILVYKDQNVADIELIFDTGDRYKFGKIVADDDTKKLLKPVDSLMIINEGKNFSTKVLNDYRNSLSQTNYYRSIDITPDLDNATDDKEVPMKIELQRKSKNIMRLGAGFSTDEGPRVLFEWEKPLLNDSGHQLSVTSKLSTVSQDANIFYKIPRNNPNLDYYYINAGQTHTEINDTLSNRSHLSFHYVANQTGKWRRDYSLRAEYEDFEQGAEDSYGYNIMPWFTISRRESSGGFDPRFGYFVSLDVSGATKAISDYSFVRTLATFKGVMSPTYNTRLLVRLQQGVISGENDRDLPPSLRFFAGGDNSIRGYGYLDKAPSNAGGLKGARYLSVGSIEYQFPIGIQSSRLALFVDGGMATDDYSSDDFLLGPGLGYRFISSYGTLRVDLGVGVDNEPKDVRLHFAFGPEF